MAGPTALLKQTLKALLEEAQKLKHDKTSDDVLAAASVDRESPDDDDFTAMVCATLRPRPHAGAGGVALPEPDDRYPLT